MELDGVIRESLKNIQDDLSTDNIQMSIEEIANIVESQFIAANLAFKKGIDVRIPIFGAFLNKDTVIKDIAKVYSLKNTISEEEYNKRITEAKIKNKKERIRNNTTNRSMTIDQLKDVPDFVNIPNKYDKLL